MKALVAYLILFTVALAASGCAVVPAGYTRPVYYQPAPVHRPTQREIAWYCHTHYCRG